MRGLDRFALRVTPNAAAWAVGWISSKLWHNLYLFVPLHYELARNLAQLISWFQFSSDFLNSLMNFPASAPSMRR